MRVHRYVGPEAVASAAIGATGGRLVREPADLRAELGEGPAWLTFVVGLDGRLRVAPRRSEHVACARGEPVLTAGELETDGTEVLAATNLSTGYCPTASSFPALAAALENARIRGPSRFEPAFEMRRCVCGARTVVKDEDFECAECGAALDRVWNFDRTVWHRTNTAHATIDVVVEAAERGEDRARVTLHEGALVLALADGAGGTTGGAEAAEAVIALEGRDPEAELGRLDARLAGETTAILARLGPDRVLSGASVGDSRLFVRARGAWSEATEGQARKALLGSGRARLTTFAAQAVDAVLVVSDGLGSYVDATSLTATVDAGGPTIGHALVDLARLRSGALRDDVSAIVVRFGR